MKHSRFFWLLPLALALTGVNCAPVDDRTGKQVGTRLQDDEPGEKPPAPVADVPRALQPRIRAAIENVRKRDLLITHSFWTVFHGILGLGLDTELVDPTNQRRVNAVEYIRQGGKIRGLEFIPTADGLDVRLGPTFLGQGHQDQFVAEMTQEGLKPDAPFTVGGKSYTFMDFVRHSQKRARVTDKQELSWALIVVGQNLGTDISWTNSEGEKLKFEDMVRYEVNEPIDTAACGGTHRLFGLSWVYHLHRQNGGKMSDVWNQVKARTALYQHLAREYQNRDDGSFSTSYFAGKGHAKDDQLRIGTTGHILEWLALSLSDEELRQGWVQDAVSALSQMILDNREAAIESGALYHAAHGLILYHTRVFGPIEGHPVPPCPPPPRD
jgi:hypothetical protein